MPTLFTLWRPESARPGTRLYHSQEAALEACLYSQEGEDVVSETSDFSHLPLFYQRRINRFVGEGLIPKHLRIYRSRDAEVFDPITVVFPRYSEYYKGHGREYPYLSMSEGGSYVHGFSKDNPVDRPRYSHLGKKIKWADLSLECKRAIWEDYSAIWKIPVPTPVV